MPGSFRSVFPPARDRLLLERVVVVLVDILLLLWLIVLLVVVAASTAAAVDDDDDDDELVGSCWFIIIYILFIPFDHTNELCVCVLCVPLPSFERGMSHVSIFTQRTIEWWTLGSCRVSVSLCKYETCFTCHTKETRHKFPMGLVPTFSFCVYIYICVVAAAPYYFIILYTIRVYIY